MNNIQTDSSSSSSSLPHKIVKFDNSVTAERNEKRNQAAERRYALGDSHDSSDMILTLLETVTDLKKALANSQKNQRAVVHALHQSASRMYAIQVAGSQLISGEFSVENTERFRFSTKDAVGTPGWASNLENYIQDAANSLIAMIQRLSAKKLVEAEQISSITQQMKSLTESVDNELCEVIDTPQFSVLDSKISDQLVKTYSKIRKEQFL